MFSFVGWSDNTYIRLLLRLALLPVVAGISYEILKLLAKTDSVLAKPFKAPGAWLQKALTTKEPDDSMIEVAIASFNAVHSMMNDKSIPEQKFPQTMPLKDFRQKAAEMLLTNGIDEPSDIDWILCEVTKLKRDELKDNVNVTPYMQIKAEKMLNERAKGKPLQYILGNTEFFGFKFFVDERVLIPRFETELLVDKVLKYTGKNSKVLDLCCGSGAIGITLGLKRHCAVTLADVSDGALEVAKQNAKNLGLTAEIVNSDLFENIQGVFDVITCNPPYIPAADISALDDNVKNYEPISALDGGTDGLDFYRKILAQACNYLADDGILVFEVGINQMEKVVALAKDFKAEEIVNDYNGIERIVVLRKNKEVSCV